jgi:hypothetical protein
MKGRQPASFIKPYHFLLALTLFGPGFPAVVPAQTLSPDSGRIVKDVSAEGSCAIVGMTAEQCQLLALQRARASAIEQAAGVSVTSSTLVTSSVLAADFIKTYSKGFIVNEKAAWLPLGQYQRDQATAPIPEYRVRIIADVFIPQKKIRPLGLKADLNKISFRNGEKAALAIKTDRKARIGLFNLTADDKVMMLFPNEWEKDNLAPGEETVGFPGPQSRIELVMQTLPGHRRDAEAFMVAALDPDLERNFPDLFPLGRPMAFSEFFKKYSEVAEHAEDVILTYEVVGEK